MKIYFFSLCIILVSMLIIDGIWLGVMLDRLYVPTIGHLLNESVRYGPAIIFYVLYAIALNVLVVQPGIVNNQGYLHLFMMGMLLGLAAYGTYDLTNLATIKNWSLLLTIIDMAWGGFITGTVTVISTYVTRYFW